MSGSIYVQGVRIILFLGCIYGSGFLYGQNNVRLISGQDTSRRPIITAVPFLGFAPDARGSSLGDVGVATPADVNSVHWNNAKLAFTERSNGYSFSYSPWLPKLINDMYIAYLTGYKRIGYTQTIGIGLRYFNLGDIFLTNAAGADQGTFSPRDFAFDFTYARKLSLNSGLGVTMRYVYSNLSRSYNISQSGNAVHGFAIDLGFFYRRPGLRFLGRDADLAFGAHISNVGSKINYSNESNENFMPANLRVGTSWRQGIDDDNSLRLSLDFNKLLVPTPPLYRVDGQGNAVRDSEGNLEIAKGKDPNRTSLNALFTSFSDAPGGFSEEIREITTAIGMEYWYRDLFSLQAGYHHETRDKGNRKYATIGAGFRYNVFGVDFSYLLPTSVKGHPLAQTLRFTLYFRFGEVNIPSEGGGGDTIENR